VSIASSVYIAFAVYTAFTLVSSLMG
jgi:hypothetical protein